MKTVFFGSKRLGLQLLQALKARCSHVQKREFHSGSHRDLQQTEDALLVADTRQFVRLFSWVGVVLAVLVLALNLLIDAYGIFGTKLVPYYDVNPRYTKFRSVVNAQPPIEGVVFGSCVTSTLRPERLSKLSGQRFFNFSTHVSLTREPEAFLQALFARDVPVRSVLLSVDNYLRVQELTEAYEQNQLERQLNARWPHFLGEVHSVVDFFGPYLFGWKSIHSSAVTAWNVIKEVTPPIEEHADGFWDWKAGLALASQDPNKLADEIVSVAGVRQAMRDVPAPEFGRTRSFDDLQRLMEKAAMRDVKVTCFIPPSWVLRPTFPWQGEYSEWQLRSLLAQCGSFFDFRLYNAETFNVRNFITYENFTTELADKVAEGIFQGRHPELYYYVTRDNVEDYLAFKRRQAKRFERLIFPRLKSITGDEVMDASFIALARQFELPPASARYRAR